LRTLRKGQPPETLTEPSYSKALILLTARLGVGCIRLSGLTKKSVYADKVLAIILGVKEGEHVSYADLSRGIHKYIKDHELKNPSKSLAPAATAPVAAPTDVISHDAVAMRPCSACAAAIPSDAIFCDLCGARQ